jgi:hypothetical protein
MTPKKYDLPAFAAGDHFPGLPLIRIKEDGVAPTSDLAGVKMRFIPADRRAVAAVELSTTNGHVTLTSGNDWEAAVPVQAVAGLSAGSWAYNYETTDALGAVRTYMQGKLVVRGELDAEPTHFTLESFTAGDQFPGIPSIRIAINGAAPATDLVSAELRFAQKGKTTVVLASVDDEITLLPMLTRTTAEGNPNSTSIIVTGPTSPPCAGEYVKGADINGKPAWYNLPNFRISYHAADSFPAGWRFVDLLAPWLEVGIPAYSAGTQASPLDVATWVNNYATGSFHLSSGGVTAREYQLCRVGDAAPYSWYQSDGTTWQLLTTVPDGGWRMFVPPQAVAGLTAGKWLAKLRTVDSDGVVRTWFSADQTVLTDC